MKLSELSAILNIPEPYGRMEFTGLANNSKQVSPGDLFIAIRGYKTHGGLYLEEAIANGAVAALVEEGALCSIPRERDFPLIPVSDLRKVQGLIAAQFYGHPSQQLRVIGVTGTNGKTTVAHLIAHLLNAAQIPTGLIGTVWIDNHRIKQPAKMTTPDSLELQKNLAEMAAGGVQAVVLEVSSHALALNRVAGLEFDVAVLTNVTQDHFDFHLNYQNYLAAKSLLFQNLHRGRKGRKYAVLNADDPGAAAIAPQCQTPQYSYGNRNQPAGLDFSGRRGEGNILTLNLMGSACQVRTTLPGAFNVSNILAAASVAFLEGVPVPKICATLADFHGVPGRYQEIDCGQPFRVMVDFAHNPAALENILTMVREAAAGRLIVVFGCEGEKDRLKRPQMGRIAVTHADLAYLTADNIYHEPLDQIFADVTRELTQDELTRLAIVPDRGEAIARAVQAANPGDFVLVAGKGHEQYLVKGSDKIPFDDIQVLKDILSARSDLRARG